MRQRIVLWGKDTEQNRHFLALRLEIDENMVDGKIISADHLTQDLEDQITKKWRNGTEIEFPASTTTFRKPLTITDTIIPENITIDNETILRRAQTEWNFMVKSKQVVDLYYSQLDEIKEGVDSLQKYEQKAWDKLKDFWSSIQEKINNQDIYREHGYAIKDQVNELFGKLKELRTNWDAEFKTKSEAAMSEFMGNLDKIEKKIESGLALQPIFEELKSIQRKLKDTDFLKSHRRKIWDRIDASFKTVKEKRFGEQAKSGKSPLDRLKHRYDGLMVVINKMRQSVSRDEKELKYQRDRIGQNGNQFEVEMRKAKVQMIEERYLSKKEKLNDMIKTKEHLEKRMEKEQQKEAKRQEEIKVRKAKEEIKEKIKSTAAEAKDVREEKLENLLHAAESINESKKKQQKSKKEAPKDQPEEMDIPTQITETIEDVVDTAKAIALVVGRRISDIGEDIVEAALGEEE